MKTKYLYNDYVKNLHGKFFRQLEDISSQHNFGLGDEFEIAICEVLRSFLPNKYGICRGFVVTSSGETAGDDVIIYDQERFPTLRLLNKDNFSRLENIPIEAVYAYIEAKHTLDLKKDITKCVFSKSIEQCKKVKDLCDTREKMLLNQADPYMLPFNLPFRNEYLPNYRNPILAVIISRYVSVEGKRVSDQSEINEFLLDKNIDINPNVPDLIIAGEHNIMASACEKPGEQHRATLFMLPEYKFGYETTTKSNLAFGIFLAQIFAALDWVRLGRMPWSDIINDAKLDEYEPQGF